MAILESKTRKSGEAAALYKKAKTGNIIELCPVRGLGTIGDNSKLAPDYRTSLHHGVVEHVQGGFRTNGVLTHPFEGKVFDFMPCGDGTEILVVTENSTLVLIEKGKKEKITSVQIEAFDFIEHHAYTNRLLVKINEQFSFLALQKAHQSRFNLSSLLRKAPPLKTVVTPIEIPAESSYYMWDPEGLVFLHDGNVVLASEKGVKVIHQLKEKPRRWISTNGAYIDCSPSRSEICLNEDPQQVICRDWNPINDAIFPSLGGWVLVRNRRGYYEIFLPGRKKPYEVLTEYVENHPWGLQLFWRDMFSVFVIK